jgi:parallel beta helix pectate lyase-like protein
MKAAFPGFAPVFGALIFCLGCGAASAQATRTWVSGVGDDANPCSRTAPCKTWAGAISKTAAAGEIDCLDSGGFGAVTITVSMTLACQAGTGGVLVAGTNGITVSVSAGSFVTLKGLDINGIGPLGGALAGVSMVGGGSLTIEDCFIYGFQGTGSGYGVYVDGTTAAHVLIENTRIRNNLVGVYVQPQGGVPNSVIIERSVVESNPTNLSVGTGGTVVISQSTFAGGPTAIAYSGGSVISYGNNVIRNAGLPTSTLPLQ